MPPKSRDRENRDLPVNLYEQRPGYFRYRHPVTHEMITLGRLSRREAITQALEANMHLQDQLAKPRLVDRITREDANTVAAWIQRYETDILPRRDLAAVSLQQLENKGATVKTSPLGCLIIDRVETRDIADHLQPYLDAGKDRMAAAVYSYLKDLFFCAIGAGWIRSKVSPVEHATRPIARVKRTRLSLDAFNAIYAAAGELDRWVRNSMALAIVSAQRREDLAIAEFRPGKTVQVWVEDRRFWINQEKTGAKVRLPLDLRLNAVGWSLEDVIKQCRDDVVSKYLIHHVRHYNKAGPGDAAHADTISRSFGAARRLSGLQWPAIDEQGKPQTPPTFHEIRSLAARLYDEQGGIDVQVLLGHRDPKTTAIYKDSRGSEWTELKIAG